MLSLSDDELSIVFNLARPIEPELRDPFLRSVAAELERHLDLGPGLVFRVRRQIQREFFNAPPQLTGYGSKYR